MYMQVVKADVRSLLIYIVFTATEEGFFKLWQGISPALYRHFGMYLVETHHEFLFVI